MNTKYMNNTIRTYILVALAIAGTSGIVRMLMNSAEEAPTKERVQRKMAVKAIKANPGKIASTITLKGKVQAIDRMDIYSEVNGVLQRSSSKFREGNSFRKGDLLLAMDPNEFLGNLRAQKSQFSNQVAQLLADIQFDFPQSTAKWKGFLNKIDVNKSLPALPKITSDKEKMFVTSKNILSSYHNIKSQESRLAKYTIRAPFKGMVSQALIKPGTLVRAGQKLGEYVAPGKYELYAPVSITDIQHIKKGAKVTFSSDNLSGSWQGSITRINDKVDESTQTALVIVELNDPQLKEGLFISGTAQSVDYSDAISIDRKLIRNNRIFIVKNDELQELSIKVLKTNNDQALITGVPKGTLVVTDNFKNMYEGRAVTVIQ